MTNSFLRCAADSQGRRNTLIEFLEWREVLECCSWPFVELSGDGIEFSLGML